MAIPPRLSRGTGSLLCQGVPAHTPSWGGEPALPVSMELSVFPRQVGFIGILLSLFPETIF